MTVVGQRDTAVELASSEEKLPASGAERRRHERFAGSFSGKLFDPVLGTTCDCIVVDLSAGGAGVRCETEILPRAPLVLYVDGFGRFDGVCVRNIGGAVGVQFTCGTEKRQRLSADLARYVRDGVTDPTRLRAHERESGGGLLFLTDRAARVSFVKLSTSRSLDCR